MLSELSSIIIREIILIFNDYKSILNFKLINKRIFKFIEYDIVIQRYYLKLRYNLIINDKDLFKYIKLLDSKCYSECLTYFKVFGNESTILVNPHNDNFIICVRESNVFIIIMSKDNVSKDKITDSILENKIENFREILFSEGYLLLDIHHGISFRSKRRNLGSTTYCKLGFPWGFNFKMRNFRDHKDFEEIRNGINLFRHVYPNEFNRNILINIKNFINVKL